MDDLIELIVRGIIKWLSAPKVERPTAPGRSAPPAAAPGAAAERVPNLPIQWQAQLRQVMLAGQPPKVKGKGRRVVAPEAVAKSVAQVVRESAPVAAAPVVRPVVRSTAATSTSVRKWMTPRVLRQQYILTEILQAPLALREQR